MGWSTMNGMALSGLEWFVFAEVGRTVELWVALVGLRAGVLVAFLLGLTVGVLLGLIAVVLTASGAGDAVVATSGDEVAFEVEGSVDQV